MDKGMGDKELSLSETLLCYYCLGYWLVFVLVAIFRPKLNNYFKANLGRIIIHETLNFVCGLVCGNFSKVGKNWKK